MSNTITVTFTDATHAEQALEKLESLHDSQRINLRGAITVSKDGDGRVSISKARKFATRHDPNAAGLSGPAINAAVGSQLGGNLMSGQAAMVGGATPDLRLSDDQAQAVADRLPANGSALLFEYTQGESAFIAAIVRDLNGSPVSVDTTDDTQSDLELALRNVTGQ